MIPTSGAISDPPRSATLAAHGAHVNGKPAKIAIRQHASPCFSLWLMKFFAASRQRPYAAAAMLALFPIQSLIDTALTW
ncbi:MAG: hypothetical protein KIT16_13500 [Rhodospirillaceae bacterium]|nr:hypothetical protein [Rhodospirillaceae bacterium]